MKIGTIIIGFTALGLLSACSNTDGGDTTGDGNAKAVLFTAYSAVQSRAHSTTAMNMPYKVRITNKGYTSTNNLTAERDVAANGTYATLYWDDISSKDMDVRTEGATVMALSDPHKTGAITSIPVNGQFAWNVAADQQTAGTADGDLLVADYIGSQSKTSDAIGLCFHHAMTKITVNLIMGDGFDASTFSGATIALPAQNTSANIDLTKTTGTDNDAAVAGGTAQDVKMNKLATPYTYNDGTQTVNYAGSFEAIVAPGKAISNSTNDVLAEITIAGTTFYLTQAQVQEKWGTQLKSGNNYVIAARLSRTHISINAVVADWTEGGSVNAGDVPVTYSNDVTGIESFDKALQAYGFSIFRKESTETTFADATQSYTYNSTAATWSASNPIYWKDGMTRYQFRALSPATLKPSGNNLTVNSGTTDYLFATTPAFTWGSEQIEAGGAVPPRTGAVNLTFKHILAKITVNFNSASTVDVSNATVTLRHAKTSGTLDMLTGALSDYGTSAFTSTSSKYTCTFLTIPQGLGGSTTETTDDVYFEITAAGNSYYVYLKDILDIDKNSQQTTIQNWEAGKHYIYTFTLNKKAITFSASVLDWEDGGTTSGNITL